MHQATTAAQMFKPQHYMGRTKPCFKSAFGEPRTTFVCAQLPQVVCSPARPSQAAINDADTGRQYVPALSAAD